MALPETIAVKYTEEEAEYLSVRPVVRQTFRMAELVDMILGVTGKDADRLRQILRAGTVVFHSYRYWWQGFEATEGDIRSLLENFPEADSLRPFRAENCVSVLLEYAGARPHPPAELRRETLRKRRLFHSRSVWDCLMDLAGRQSPAYQGYSYPLRADLYRLEISEEAVGLLNAAARRAPRSLRKRLEHLWRFARILLICPRGRE